MGFGDHLRAEYLVVFVLASASLLGLVSILGR
jgi:hypothetical protein